MRGSSCPCTALQTHLHCWALHSFIPAASSCCIRQYIPSNRGIFYTGRTSHTHDPAHTQILMPVDHAATAADHDDGKMVPLCYIYSYT
eukprot:23840-Chlamydomonas_euryale.AAC.6